METEINKKIFNWYWFYGWKLMKTEPDKQIEVEDILNLYNSIQEEKKLRLSKKKHLPEILVPNITKKEWCNGAFTICFVYSNKGNFVLKGWYGDIKEYLRDLNLKGYKYFYYQSFYQYGIERGGWQFYKKDVIICEPTLDKSLKVFEPYHFIVKNTITKKKFKFKRLPKKWIPEFDEL